MQQRPDGRGTHPDTELAQLPADPHAAPPGVLPGHPEDQLCGLRVDWWPARRALLAVGPLPSDQHAVPAQQCLGRDEKRRCPPLSGEHPAGGGEQGSVACGELGTAGLTAQHPKLMPQDQISKSLVPSSWLGKTSRRVSRRTVNQSMKSIEGWYGTPAHGANPGFRAPQGEGRSITMARRRHTPEQIIRELREADRLPGEGARGGRCGPATWRCRRRRITRGGTRSVG